MSSFLPVSAEDLISFACMGFVPMMLTIWFVVSLVRFLCSGKLEKQIQKKRMILMIVSGSLMTLCYVGMIFLYYAFAQVMQSM